MAKIRINRSVVTNYVGLNILRDPKILINPRTAIEVVAVDAAIATNRPEAVSALQIAVSQLSPDLNLKRVEDYPSHQEIANKVSSDDTFQSPEDYGQPDGTSIVAPYADTNQYPSQKEVEAIQPSDKSYFKDITYYHLQSIPKNVITIIDLDCRCEPGSPWLGIDLQGTPLEVDVDPSSSFNPIGSIGRNTPHYHYTGGEDTLEMTIDWYATQNDHMDVLTKCRWLEALTKNDGYRSSPHRVMINWGTQSLLNDGTDTPFAGMVWLLVAAPYKINTFNNGILLGDARGQFLNVKGDFLSTSLRPKYATQKLTFKRLVEYNLTREQILFPNIYNSWTDRFGKKYFGRAGATEGSLPNSIAALNSSGARPREQ